MNERGVINHENDCTSAPFEVREATSIAFLRNIRADRIAFGARTLLDHLSATGEILDRWGAGHTVSRAGLFHAVYQHVQAQPALLSLGERACVRALLGSDAERLVYLFGTLDRGSLYRAIDCGETSVTTNGPGVPERVGVTDTELRSLLLILWANALAQAPYVERSEDARRSEARTVARYSALFPERALDELHASIGPPPRVAARRGVAALFNLEDLSSLLDHWPVLPFRGSGPVTRLAGLVDYNFAELVAMKRSFTMAFLQDEDGSSKSKMLAAGEVSSHYDAGWVVYFHGLRSTGMDQWVAAIDDDLGLLPGVTRVSAFASRRTSGLPPHFDANDNFVCQARGAKRWRIARGRHVRFPTVGYTVGCGSTPALRAEMPDGLPDAMPVHDTIELQPGDVMFMPRGTLHETETTEKESIHFNIQGGLATWRDLLQFVVESSPALRSETLRAPVLRLFDGATIRPGIISDLKDRLSAAVEVLCRDEVQIDREDFLAFMAKRKDVV